jgi:hypothetical protein
MTLNVVSPPDKILNLQSISRHLREGREKKIEKIRVRRFRRAPTPTMGRPESLATREGSEELHQSSCCQSRLSMNCNAPASTLSNHDAKAIERMMLSCTVLCSTLRISCSTRVNGKHRQPDLSSPRQALLVGIQRRAAPMASSQA